jgi:hypothetical protein
MRVNSYNKFFMTVAKIMNTEVKSVKPIEGRYKVELANHVYLNVYRGVSGSLFIHDHRGIAHITSCYDFEEFKTMKDLYERLITDYGELEKNYYDYTSEDFINSGIAKECTNCPDFCEEDCIENAECARGNDVFDGCKQKLPKTETNKIKGHIYIDTDSVKVAPLPEQQTGEESITDTIIADDNCSYNSEVLRAKQVLNTKYGNSYRKHLHAIMNPEWHHVSLATLANIDFDMLDAKRQIYFKLNKDFKKMCNDLRKCKSGRSFDARLCNFRAKLTTLNTYEKISLDMSKYLDRQISMMNVECGMWTSRVEIATGCHKSRKHNHHALKY